MDLAGQVEGQLHYTRGHKASVNNLSWGYVGTKCSVYTSHTVVKIFLWALCVSSILIQEPVLSAEDVNRLSCAANTRKPLNVLKKVRNWCMQVICDCWVFFLWTLNLCVKNIKCYFQYFIYTATETHHLLSTELCEHGDQPVSTQGGGCAPTTDAVTNKGKTDVETQDGKTSISESVEINLVQ